MERFWYLIKRNREVLIASLAINIVAIVGLLTAANYLARDGGWLSQIIPTSLKADGPIGPFLGSDDNRVVSVVKKTNPAVVSIVISKNAPLGLFSPSVSKQEVGGGSGFLVTPDGLVVTNRHVVDDPAAIYMVYTYDGKRYPAKVIAKDPTQDVAIVKINGHGFPFLSFGNSNQLALGQKVIAIGNVFDQFKNSVSVGVISGLSRTIVAGDYFGNIESLEGVIQTDAAINPGNSGGPLLDTNGKVIGVNVAIARGSENVGFALSANTVQTAVMSVMRTGKILRPYLGVRYVPIDQAIKDQYNLPVDYGVYVLGDRANGEPAVAMGSPAAKAGIEEGDIILEVDNTKLSDNTTLAGLFQNKHPGDVVDLQVLHKGSVRSVKIKLGEFPLK